MVKYLRENNEIKQAPLEHIKGATLLSEEEAERLLPGVFTDFGSSWLRDCDGYYASDFYVDGELYTGLTEVDLENGVCPALILNLHMSGLHIGDEFQFGGYPFKIISPKYAICLDAIDCCVYSEAKYSPGSYNYADSNAKQVIDRWFQDAMDNERGLLSDTQIEAAHDFGF